MTSFLQDLKDLANPAPKGVQVEEDDVEDPTRAQVTVENDEVLHNSGSKLSEKKLKTGRKFAVLLADSDPKYSGTVVDRSELFSEDDEISDDADEPEQNGVQDSGEDSGGLKSASNSDISDEGDSGEDPEVPDDVENEEEETPEQETEPDLSRKVDAKSDKEKGEAVRNQIAVWDKLLGVRIRMQKVCSLVNQLPQTSEAWEELKSNRKDESIDRDTKTELAKCRRSMKSTLDRLQHLQSAICPSSEIADTVISTGKRKRQEFSNSFGPYSDEEVISCAEEDDSGVEEDTDTPAKKRQKIKQEELPKILRRRHDGFRSHRNDVLLKWFERTRLASGRFSAKKDFSGFETNVLKQIDQIMSNKYRLIARTQTKRSVYEVLGKKNDILSEENGLDVEKSADFDPEIFDDDDFYQHLLRELIDKKSSTATDPALMSKQWLEMQKLRNKATKKKKVDTKASKARKVRYDVQQKLVNFMAPVLNGKMNFVTKKPTAEWSEESKSELFNSLFGGKSW